MTMIKSEQHSIMNKAIRQYGAHNQLAQTIEELAELQREIARILSKRSNKKYLAAEIADVEIMLWQLKNIFRIHIHVEDWRLNKLERLKNELDKAK